MGSKNNLFTLIHSLSKSELIYIKRNNLKKSEEKLHTVLLDANRILKDYSKEALIAKLPKDYPTKNLERNSTYLYNVILKKLHRYHSKNNIEIEVQNHIAEAIVLGERGLKKQALKRLFAAEKMANSIAKHDLISIIKEKIWGLKFDGDYSNDSIQYRKDIFESTIKSQIVRELHLKNIQLINAGEASKEDDNQQTLEKIYRDTCERDLENDSSIPVRSLKQNINFCYHYFKGNDKQAFEAITYSLKLFHENHDFRNFHFDSYIKMLVNFIIGCEDINEKARVLQEINHILVIEKGKNNLKYINLKALYFAFTLKLFIGLNQGRLLQNDFTKNISIFLQKEGELLSKSRFEHTLFNLCVLQFQLEDYKNCIKSCEDYLASSFNEKENIAEVKLIAIMAFNELDETDILEYRLLSLKRYVKKNELEQFMPEIIPLVEKYVRKKITQENLSAELWGIIEKNGKINNLHFLQYWANFPLKTASAESSKRLKTFLKNYREI